MAANLEPVPVGPAADAAAIAGTPRMSLPRALLRTARPKQWLKNVLVFSAPAAAGVLDEPRHLAETFVAFAAFCLAASGTYFLNDALDHEADRQHPVKRSRPIAAGALDPGVAKGVAVVLVLAGIGLAAPLNGGRLAAVVGGYVALTFSYSTWLKHEAVLDLAAVAAGFVLRAIAGGVATNVGISDWFLIVAGAGSLFIVTGKRHAEQVELGDAGIGHRSTLGAYSTQFLAYVRAVASSVAITGYCLWAFENARATGDATWFRLSIIPFVLGVLRYALDIEQGHGGAPEEVMLSDRVLQVLGLVWVGCFMLGVHG